MSASRFILSSAASSVSGHWTSAGCLNRFQSVSGRCLSQAVRRNVSKEERVALRAARRERANKFLQEQTGVDAASSGASKRILASKWSIYAAVGIPSALLAWGISDTNSPPAQFSRMIGLTGVIESLSDEYVKPAHEKLLPDWSQMPNVPHDIPIPHTLVLDLENTLVSSTWDRKYGWRHAKRPGVDKFLMDMAQYYEIVLYSPSLDGIADPVVQTLDKNGCIMHRLYREATHYQDGVHVKDISRLNRNVNRIVVIDDDPEEVKFSPENLIRVKPYTDPMDREDNTLARITPFLIEIARENYNDIPALLRQYEGMDADEIADEQEKRVQYFRGAREERMSRGLGGLAKMARKSVDIEPELEVRDTGSVSPQPQQLTAKDLVGAAPPSANADSGIMGFLNRRQQEKEEQQRRKFEKWNEVMLKKQKQKAEQNK
eukprot:scaffold4347_cov117-Cylindrotheca_fusiformis.AAC.8